MNQVLLPLFGVLAWAAHLTQTIRVGRPGWLRWTWMAGLPIASLALLLWWNFLIPKPHPATMFINRNDALFVGNAALGIAEWLLLLLLEPLLRRAARRRTARP